MPPADILTALAILATGSLIGAGVVRLAGTGDPHSKVAIDICTFGFLVLGLSVWGYCLWASSGSAWVSGLLVSGSLVGMASFCAALAVLAGQPAPGRMQWALLTGGCLAVGALGALVGNVALMRAYVLAMAAFGTVMTFNTRQLVFHPRDAGERALSLAILALAASSWLRAILGLITPGEPPHHLLHVPASMLWPYAITYALLPVLIATLLLTLVNARLRQDLNLRATTDELTGTLNRRALREAVPAMLRQQLPGQRCVALLMLDIDHFKAVNDRYGHASGDLVLKAAGTVLREHLRADALLSRFGGEEFVVLVPVDDLRSARMVAERLREAVATSTWVAVDGRRMLITLSVGVTLIGPREALDVALRRTDEALYRAKREGRNQVQVAMAVA